MQQFRNWRWYKDKGGGPIVDLGSHQIDVYSWFLGTNPVSVVADGGTDYWDGREWYDNVMAIYEYQTEKGSVRAFYQTITTNSGQGYFEQFMGDEGTLVISESAGRTKLYREGWVDEEKWAQWVKKGYLIPIEEEELPEDEQANVSVAMKVYESPLPPSYDIPLIDGYDKPCHYAHLVNFFDTIRGKAQLNCPAEVGYETAVAVLKVNEAVEAERKLRFQPDEFTV